MFPLRDLNPTRTQPVVTIALIAVNIAIWLLWQPRGGGFEEFEFLLANAAVACELTTGDPLTVREINLDFCSDGATGVEIFPEKRVYAAAVVSMFLHGGLLHLLGNMWFLWIFGNNIEEAYGRVGYLTMYLAAGVAATAAFVVFNANTTVPLVGASGAIAGVLGAYLVLHPMRPVLSLIVIAVLPVPAAIFLGLWFVTQFQFAGAETGVAWEAHVFGFLFGVALTLLLRSPLNGRLRELHRPALPS